VYVELSKLNPTAMKAPPPYATPVREPVVPETACVQFLPSVDVRMVP